jgi:hypothetical protein
MPAGLGSASSLRIKSEATPGTKPASGFVVVPVTGFDLVPKVASRLESAVLGSSFAAVNAAYRSPVETVGTVSAEGDYNGAFDWLLYGILGNVQTTGGGADPYTNLYTPDATPPTYSGEYIAGNIPSGKNYWFKNLLVQELVLSGDAAGKLEARANLVAEAEASASGGDTPTAGGLITPTAVPIQAAKHTVKWNMGVGTDTTYCVARHSITLRRPLAPPRACYGNPNFKAPTFSGPLSVTFEFEVEWEDEAIYRAFVDADVLTAIRMQWTGPALLTGFYGLDIRINQADLDEAGPPPWRDNGVLKSLVRGTAYGNAGSGATIQPISATTINGIDGDTVL